MNIRWIVKICWVSTAMLGVIIIGSILFLVAESKEKSTLSVPDFVSRKKKVAQVQEYTFHSFSDIWNTQINVKRPVQHVKTLNISKNWLEQLLKRHIRIKNIWTDDFAVISIDGVDHLIQPKKSSTLQDRRGWELVLESRKIIVVKIVYGKGIKFQCSGKEAWLLHKTEGVVFQKGESSKALPPGEASRQVAENQWLISRQEGSTLLQNYDRYVQELAPIQDSRGLRIRRVPIHSKAYKYGLRPNDIILNVNGMSLHSLRDIRRLIRKNRHKKRVVVELLRNSRRVQLTFQIPNR